jgi:hypothetical protein
VKVVVLAVFLLLIPQRLTLSSPRHFTLVLVRLLLLLLLIMVVVAMGAVVAEVPKSSSTQRHTQSDTQSQGHKKKPLPMRLLPEGLDLILSAPLSAPLVCSWPGY